MNCLTLLITSACLGAAPVDIGRWQATIDDLGDVHAVADVPGRNEWAVLNADTAEVSWPESPENPTLDLSPFVHRPHGMAIGPNGVIYAVDREQHRVMFFDAQGQLLGGFGGRSDAPHALRRPHAIDVNNSFVAVADTGHDRIQLYEHNGRHIGTLPQTDWELRGPQGVAIDDLDRIWITDTEQHRVLCIKKDGSVVHRIGTWGTFPGHFMQPTGIDAHDGRVVVADQLNHRIQVFDAETGTLTESWGMHSFRPREGQGKVHYPADVALLDDGSVVVAEPFEERVQHFGVEGVEIEPPSMAPRGAQSHFGPIAATSGRFFSTWEPEIRAIHLFDLERETPIRLSTFGTPGNGPGEIGNITALALDAESQRLWAVDSSNRRIHQWALTPPPSDAPRFDPNLAVLSKSIPLPMAGPGELMYTDQGLLFIDQANAQAWEISESGDHRMSNLELSPNPSAAIMTRSSAAGHTTIAVLDGISKRIKLLHADPNSSAADWIALDALEEPVDMAMTSNGDVLVVDRAGHRVHRFDPNGQPLGSWGRQGIDHEEFWRPAAVVVDRQDRVIVLDHGNHRAQMFTPEGTWLMTFGGGRAWRWGFGRLPTESLPTENNESTP
ncbi:MAG: NHL repeat-containing protein [Phycisphaerales bacterium]|nr:NHL repeat-containing protein [Phycisphaerales bacterium]